MAIVLFCSQASAFTLNVVDGSGNPVTGFRWLVEEDNTDQPTLPATGVLPQLDGVSLAIHKSYAPVAASGRSDTAEAVIDLPADKRYFVSVLPYAGFSNSGASVAVGQGTATVVVDPVPLPTAQISLLAFVDHAPVNNIFDPQEFGLGGCSIQIAEAAGRQSQDAFGNPLGTQYQFTVDPVTGAEVPVFDPVTGEPVVTVLGDGTLTTLTLEDFCAAKGLGVDPVNFPNACSTTAVPIPVPNPNPYNLQVGEALIKYLVPGKYGVIVVPPGIDDTAAAMTWSQTATIEGTPTVDAWVKANEPTTFVEGFGTGFKHVFFGFVKTAPATPSVSNGQTITAPAWQAIDPVTSQPVVDRTAATGSIEGTLRLNHFSRPPNLQGYFPGVPVSDGWVGLNDPVTGEGLYAAPCDPGTGHFVINNVPPGTYQLVNWDTPLDYLFGFRTVTVGPGAGDTGEALQLGDVLVFRWFGALEGTVFLDNNRNGIQDASEIGIPDQAVNLRFRDGSIYQQTVSTPPDGEYSLGEVFPFFKWLVTEVDFARFKATGATNVVDNGGDPVGLTLPHGPVGVGKLTPQPQAEINPNTGDNLSRTVTGEVLTQAMHLFLGQTNVIDWGKAEYLPGENGGISGIVYYAVTRAENDPREAVGEPWEPGIPRVVLNLYRDSDGNGVIDDLNGDGLPTKADADNYPFEWAPVHQFLDDGSPNPDWTGVKGAEDVDHNGNGLWNPGDALNTAISDSFDDNRPSGCIQELPVIRGEQIPECADAFGTWNQIRDGVFDGGYAFNSYFPGGMVSGSQEVDGLPTNTYIVEAVTPPNYEPLKEEDKNVDFGLSFQPSPLVLPPPCVGDPHLVPDFLSFNTEPDGVTPLPGVDQAELIPGFFAGQTRPLCNMKQITAAEARNAAVDFFYFTQVPKAGRVVGFVNNDLGAEFNQASPNFGEKLSPSWIPVSFHDWTGREITRVYVDEFGGYNALLPSTFTVNVPAPSGVSPNMLSLILNNPTLPDGSKDPFYNPIYSVTPWTFNYTPGKVTYTDTPLVPLAAFAVNEVKVDTAWPEGTPVIGAAIGPEPEAGALLCNDRASARTITITSAGQVQLINPAFDPAVPGQPFLITRDFSFGTVVGQVLLNNEQQGDVPLDLVSWTPDKVVATVPAGTPDGTYQLTVTRGDNGRTTMPGETFFLSTCGAGVVQVVAEDLTPGSHPIQDAIDAAAPGDLILVGPGTFNENVIMYKPVRLQGAGIGKTFINGNPTPVERLNAWHARIDAVPPAGLNGAAVTTLMGINPFAENEAPCIFVAGETVFIDPLAPVPPDPNNPPATATFNPGFPFAVPGQALIDGFTLSGSIAGGGIHVFSGAAEVVISNNEITGNQGNYAGGIAVGITGGIPIAYPNANLVIRNNHIHKNGGIQGAGGINLESFTNNYLVEGNLIEGNFSRYNGGGIAHVDLSMGNNVIRNNRILFNENFFGALLNLAGDGGGIFVGSQPVIDPATGLPVPATGTGHVTIEGNLIQGNMAGSGNGGGIRVYAVNGDDVVENPNNAPPVDPVGDPPQWYELKIFNNIIVNNVAGLAGAGISLQDVLRATIVNNTIVHNDTTATSSLAFEAGASTSTTQPAGIASGMHSSLLLGAIDPALLAAGEPIFSSPTLVNNIILENRSFFTTNGGLGGLSPNTVSPYWDMGVTGTATPEFLNPVSSLLTSLTDTQDTAVPPHAYDASNLAADPAAPVFRRAYLNALEAAQVVDEGGNNINVRFTPISSLAGDYHLRSGSLAVDAGAPVDTVAFPTLAADIDGDIRPNPDPAPGAVDIVADEFYPVPPTQIGVWRQGFWYLDNGNGIWDPLADIQSEKLNLPASIPVAGDWDGDGRTEVGFYNQGAWYLDSNGDGVWSGDGVDRLFANFGAATDIPVTGDWNGDGTTEVGVFRQGQWFLDDGDGAWDAALDTTFANFGAATDKPVPGDWDGDGAFQVGTWRPSSKTWYLDSGDGQWDLVNGIDVVLDSFGAAGDIPVVGDWDGDGISTIGTYRNGQWFLGTADGFMRGTVSWNGTLIDVADASFGATTDLPVAGDWNGDGKTQLGVYRQGQWFLDFNGNRQWDPDLDKAYANFGLPTDKPVSGDMDGDGIDEIGVFRPGTGQWFFDLDKNGSWSRCQDQGGTDLCLGPFGAPNDIPVTGDWNGDGVAEVGTYRNGTWFLDTGNGTWDNPAATPTPETPDIIYVNFGTATDIPVNGIWNTPAN